MEKKVILITGASSGMGKETAKALVRQGHVVYAAARRVDEMKDIGNMGGFPLQMDITKDSDVQQVVATILGKEQKIDVLINNAGYGSYGAIEDVSIEEAKRQFEVNLFGLARITQAVLPVMRKNKSGRIVNISSIGGKIYTPFGGWYHATKHALEGWSDCLRFETKPFGIDVVIVEPGGVYTPWGIIAAEHLKETSAGGAYAEKAAETANYLIKMYSEETKLSSPEAVAKVIVKAALKKKPKTRYATGYMAKPVLFARRWVSDRLFDRIIAKFM